MTYVKFPLSRRNGGLVIADRAVPELGLDGASRAGVHRDPSRGEVPGLDRLLGSSL